MKNLYHTLAESFGAVAGFLACISLWFEEREMREENRIVADQIAIGMGGKHD